MTNCRGRGEGGGGGYGGSSEIYFRWIMEIIHDPLTSENCEPLGEISIDFFPLRKF